MEKDYKQLFVGGDLSGIQKFLYNISSKKAAVSLKGRSYYLQQYMDNVCSKIEKVAKEIYGAEGIELSEIAKESIKYIVENGYDKLPVCIAKTQYSFSDDPKNLECLEPFKIHVQDIILKAGAEFIVVITGKIFTMPGLPKVPAAESIDIDEKGEIVGLF